MVQGIMLRRAITTSRISWPDLKGVVLGARTTDINVGPLRLVLVTRERPRVPAGLTGGARDGALLTELRPTLLAMRQRQLVAAPAPPDTADEGVVDVLARSSTPHRMPSAKASDQDDSVGATSPRRIRRPTRAHEGSRAAFSPVKGEGQ